MHVSHTTPRGTDSPIGTYHCGQTDDTRIAKLEIGRLAMVDPDHVEDKSLNRIAGATASDVGRLKVEVLRDRLEALGLGTQVDAIPDELAHLDALSTVAGADVVFGCVDSIDGRHLLNRLATFYALP